VDREFFRESGGEGELPENMDTLFTVDEFTGEIITCGNGCEKDNGSFSGTDKTLLFDAVPESFGSLPARAIGPDRIADGGISTLSDRRNLSAVTWLYKGNYTYNIRVAVIPACNSACINA